MENENKVININKGKEQSILETVLEKGEDFKEIMKEKFKDENFKEGFMVGIWSAGVLAGLTVIAVAIGKSN